MKFVFHSVVVCVRNRKGSIYGCILGFLRCYKWIDRSGQGLEQISHTENGFESFDQVVWLEVPV